MAHKTLISGTAYEISGGKTLIDGTAYNIKNGKTLVDGTAYEIGFGSLPIITITGSGWGYAKVTIDGTTYGNDILSANYNLSLPIGTKIVCYIRAESKTTATIQVNGEVVKQAISTVSLGAETASYIYTVTKDATITLKYDGTMLSQYGTITITEH